MATSKRTTDFPAPIKTLQSLTDLFAEAVFVIDRSDRIVLANHAAQTMTALAETALVGQPIKSILSLNVPKRIRSKTPNPQTETTVPATVHGESHWATFIPLPNLHYFAKVRPRPDAFVIVTPATSGIHDHTTATIYLQIVGQLTLLIAHDFNNALTSIIGNAELIKDQLPADLPELDDVIRKSREMAHFIDRLQQYARQQAPADLVTATPSRIHDHTSTTIYLQIVGHLAIRIAHDFNNALTSIIGNAELIKQQLAADSPELDAVIRKSREMAQFIDRLQQYARQQPLTTYATDLNSAIHDLLPFARSLLGPTIQINFLPAEELPLIYMDRPRIDQLLRSILLSCEKEMPSGGRITIETEHANLDADFTSTHPGARPGTYSRLSFTDSSNGMDAKRVASIFDFPTDHVLDSSSLGLPIVYSIVKEFNGYIALETWVGKGTRFDIYIPSNPARFFPVTQPELLDSSGSYNSGSSTNSSLILVADDDPDIQNIIGRCVSRIGYTTTFAKDGRTALEVYERLTAQKNQPTLLIADLGLPEIDGRALSLTIHERYPSAHILLTSGHKIDINPTTGKTPEGFTFLDKPFDPNTLLITIERLLKQKDYPGK